MSVTQAKGSQIRNKNVLVNGNPYKLRTNSVVIVERYSGQLISRPKKLMRLRIKKITSNNFIYGEVIPKPEHKHTHAWSSIDKIVEVVTVCE